MDILSAEEPLELDNHEAEQTVNANHPFHVNKAAQRASWRYYIFLQRVRREGDRIALSPSA